MFCKEMLLFFPVSLFLVLLCSIIMLLWVSTNNRNSVSIQNFMQYRLSRYRELQSTKGIFKISLIRLAPRPIFKVSKNIGNLLLAGRLWWEAVFGPVRPNSAIHRVYSWEPAAEYLHKLPTKTQLIFRNSFFIGH